MKLHKILFLLLTYIIAFSSHAQQSLNINFLSNLDYNYDLSDVWGYANDEGEYALVGVFNGISVVDVTNASNPVELGFFQGPESMWRDLKTWGDYLYCINDQDGDGGAGLQILNLEELISGSNNPTYIENMGLGFETAHNIYIDENGVLYVFGADYGEGGALMYDLIANPENPPLLGVFDDYYLHDGMARGDTLWGGAIDDGVFIVVDVSDKQNPFIIGSQATPNNFSHNCWISNDGDYLFTTDEVSGAYVAAFDVSNLSDIEEVDRIQAWSPQTNVIPHNTHVDGDFIVTSYYTDGVSVVDVSSPSNMVEVGYYDTSDDYSGSGFHGAWGAYPWLPSGNILVTDIEAGLFVLEPKYTNASFLEGTVRDAVTGAPLSNAQIQISGSNAINISDLGGHFEIGVAVGGTYEITISSSGYNDLVQSVNLSPGQTLNIDAQLVLLGTYNAAISVVNASNFNGVSEALVYIHNELDEYQLISSENGELSISLLEGTYSVSIAAWGYQTLCSEFSISELETGFQFEMNRGYSDDFSVDLGWSIQSDESLTFGAWERVVPFNISSVGPSPNQDASGDCGNFAFVTDNGDYETFDFDVDKQNWGASLNSELTSPLIATGEYCEINNASFFLGSIAVIERGGCQFGLKALNAQNSGAIAVIIYDNNNSGQPLGMAPGGDGDQVTIPVFSMSGADGNDLVDLVANTSDNFNATLSSDNLTITFSSASHVSEGKTQIISPVMDLSYYSTLNVSFNTWFYNEGDESFNDSLLIKLTNGTESFLIDSRTFESSASEWVTHEISIDSPIQLTNQMQLIIEAIDASNGQHYLEAGFDHFLITSDNMSVFSYENDMLNLFPNPSVDGVVNVQVNDNSILLVHDLTGSLLFEKPVSRGISKIDLSFLASGSYLVSLHGDVRRSSILLRN